LTYWQGTTTHDSEYDDLHRRLTEIEAELKKIKLENENYFNSLEQIFERQVGFANAMVETQILDLFASSVNGNQTDNAAHTTNKDQMPNELYEQFIHAVIQIRKILGPEIEFLRTNIMTPINFVLVNIGGIRKITKKRQHKLLDLDRYKAALAKLLAKHHNRSVSDEKAFFITQNNLEIAEQEYNYLNTLLKKELPLFFELTEKIMRSLFISLYYVQLNIYYKLYEELQSIVVGTVAIRDWNQNSDVVTAYHTKISTVLAKAKEIHLIKFRLIESQKKLYPGAEITVPTTKPTATQLTPVTTDKDTVSRSGGPEYCISLYNYVPQANGILPLAQGDIVEIIQRTQCWNDWWTGRLVTTGETGIFPANYVKFQ
jgi:amphiphysin